MCSLCGVCVVICSPSSPDMFGAVANWYTAWNVFTKAEFALSIFLRLYVSHTVRLLLCIMFYSSTFFRIPSSLWVVFLFFFPQSPHRSLTFCALLFLVFLTLELDGNEDFPARTILAPLIALYALILVFLPVLLLITRHYVRVSITGWR